MGKMTNSNNANEMIILADDNEPLIDSEIRGIRYCLDNLPHETKWERVTVSRMFATIKKLQADIEALKVPYGHL
jgi:hypothetical protein